MRDILFLLSLIYNWEQSNSYIMQRFWNKVDNSDDCWNWKASIRNNGYGAFRLEGSLQQAHRVSYILHYGGISDGLYVCHKCDNRKCVNPNHLFLGTCKDNNQDAIEKGRNPIYNNRSLDKDTFIKVISALDNKCGKTLKSISKELGVSYSIIKRIARGETYKN